MVSASAAGNGPTSCWSPRDHAFVHDAGFTDLEIGDFGQTLVAESRAEVTADGGLVLLTERCI